EGNQSYFTPYSSEPYLLMGGVSGFTRDNSLNFGAGAIYSGAASADIDGDQDLDLLGAENSNDFPGESVILARQTPSGFTYVPDYSNGNAITAADVNRDGRLDLVTGPILQLQLGTGGGSLGASQSFYDFQHSIGGTLAWGDFDGDGDL